MALNTKTLQTNRTGISVTKASVKAIENLSHQMLPFLNNAFDLAIKIKLDIGQSFDKEVTIFGNFKRDTRGSVVGFGSAFKVAKFFETLGIRGSLAEGNELPNEWLSSAVGKWCFVLDYVVGVKENGKLKYYTWDLFGSDEETLVHDFYQQVAKGYPKNFIPELAATRPSELMGDAFEPSTHRPSTSIQDDITF